MILNLNRLRSAPIPAYGRPDASRSVPDRLPLWRIETAMAKRTPETLASLDSPGSIRKTRQRAAIRQVFEHEGRPLALS